MTEINRRGFLATVGTAVCSVWTTRSLAIGAQERTGQAPLRLSLAAYSMKKYLTAQAGSQGAMDIMGFAEYAAGLGVDAVELTSYYFPEDVTVDFIHPLKRRCHLLGLDISGGAIRNNFTLSPGNELDECFEHVQKWIDLYAELGAPVIRVFGGTPPKDVPREQAVKNCVANLDRACEMSGKRGIMLALENHDFLCDVGLMLEIVKAVQSPWFGVNWDSGNFRSEDPYSDLEKTAPYAVNVQLKVEILGRGGKREPADFARLVNILKTAGYKGYIVLEYEAEEDPYQGVPRIIGSLRELLAR